MIHPEPPGIPPDADIGNILFEDFADPLDAKSLEVLRFNEELAEIQQFKVAEIDGVWSIPSHSGYPADAENQIRDAATIVTDLEILGVATDLAKKHDLWLIEDNCESLGSITDTQEYAGTVGQLGSYSFFFSHHIQTMEGGMILSDNKDRYYKSLFICCKLR